MTAVAHNGPGWIRVDRSILWHEVFGHSEPLSYREAYLWMQCRADFAGPGRSTLKASMRELMRAWGWRSVRRVHDFIVRVEKAGLLKRTKRTRSGTQFLLLDGDAQQRLGLAPEQQQMPEQSRCKGESTATSLPCERSSRMPAPFSGTQRNANLAQAEHPAPVAGTTPCPSQSPHSSSVSQPKQSGHRNTAAASAEQQARRHGTPSAASTRNVAPSPALLTRTPTKEINPSSLETPLAEAVQRGELAMIRFAAAPSGRDREKLKGLGFRGKRIEGSIWWLGKVNLVQEERPAPTESESERSTQTVLKVAQAWFSADVRRLLAEVQFHEENGTLVVSTHNAVTAAWLEDSHATTLREIAQSVVGAGARYRIDGPRTLRRGAVPQQARLRLLAVANGGDVERAVLACCAIRRGWVNENGGKLVCDSGDEMTDWIVSRMVDGIPKVMVA